MGFHIQQKTCPVCGAGFGCGPDHETGACWCDRFPPILTPTPGLDCLCPACLTEVLKPRIAEYIAAVPRAERAANPAFMRYAKPGASVAGLDSYKENGYTVFTAWYHLKRGACCGNGCRHCPY